MSALEVITNYDSLVIFSIFFISVIVIIILTGLFHSGPIIRTNILFNALGGIVMAVVFVWLIFKFMGNRINILGIQFDIGMIVYIFIVCFVIFVFGN